MSKGNGVAQSVVGVRLADGDEDIIAIHRFLCVVAQPVLIGAIDAEKSMAEVERIVTDPEHGFALMAVRDGVMVGTIGCVMPKWWYGDDQFCTDRWFFVVPGIRSRGIGALLLGEAAGLCHSDGIPLLLQGKIRKRGKFYVTEPVLVMPGDDINLGEVAEHVLRERGDRSDRVDADA